MSINDLELAALLANVETREQCQRLYDIFDSFPLGDGFDNSRMKMEYIFERDLIVDAVKINDCGYYTAIITMPTISCFDFVKNLTIDVTSKHSIDVKIPTDLNCLYPSSIYCSPDKKHYKLNSQWFVNDFYEYEDDMKDNGQYDDDEREEQCNYRDLFDDTDAIVYADNREPFELPIIIKFTWEEVHMMHQNYALNHFKRINLRELK